MKLDTAKYEEKMKKTVASFEETLSTIRAGQASSAVLNGISFEYYGTMTPLNTMADIKVTDSKTLKSADAADLNGDGKLNGKDLTLLKRIILS